MQALCGENMGHNPAECSPAKGLIKEQELHKNLGGLCTKELPGGLCPWTLIDISCQAYTQDMALLSSQSIFATYIYK